MQLLQLLILGLSLSPVSSQRLARQIDQSPNKRAEYVGGYAWTTDQVCSAEWSSQCKSTTYTNACCRTGETCFGVVAAYCCPTGVDCQTLVYTLPACADPTMDMYILQSPWYICCKPGKIAVKVYGGGALCMDPDQNVPASLHLTVTSQVGVGAVATAPIASATGASNGTRTTNIGGSETSRITSNSTPTSSTSTADSVTSQPLSKPAIIGIAVGGGIAILIAVWAGWKCGQKRKMREFERQMAAMPPGPPQQSGLYTMYGGTPQYKGPSVETVRPVLPMRSQGPMQSPMVSRPPMATHTMSPPPASPSPMSPSSPRAMSPPPPAYGATPAQAYSEVHGEVALPPELQSHTITRRPVNSTAERYEM